MNRKAFYDTLRPTLGSFSVPQVDGFTRILDEGERRHTPLSYLAYILATSWHETARTMQPITEYGSRSYFDKYEPGTRIGLALGNTLAGDGYKFRGRGYVQLTGRRNYALAAQKLGHDYIASPDLLLKPEHSVPVLFAGMNDGWFTGKDLDDYIDGVDEADAEDLREFANARRIINGTDRQVAIGKLALLFERALKAALYIASPASEKPAPLPQPSPKTPAPLISGSALIIENSMSLNIGRVLSNPLGQVVMRAAANAAVRAAENPSTPADANAVMRSRPEIEVEMAKEIAKSPELQHVTNSEAWYQKRSRWAAIIGIASPFIAMGARSAGIEFGTGEVELAAGALAAIGSVWAAYLAYRAGTATKPLFSGGEPSADPRHVTNRT